MSLEEVFGNDFKSEIKSSGAKLLDQDKVSISSGSDTSIQAYVKATPLVKVGLSTEDIGSETFVAQCSCPMAKKSQFCKHIWAVLLCTELKYPDFLSAKKIIEKAATQPESVDSYQANAKVKAAEYRKDQYQRQKQRAKDLKDKRKGVERPSVASRFPPAVGDALEYFDKNGFSMPTGPSEEVLSEAKRKLSRVFHPDKGGSNEEVVELNQNCDLLMQFLRSR